jgi:hypothetical protein
LQDALCGDASLLADILDVLIAECAAQLIAIHRHVFPFAKPRLDVLIQASSAQPFDETFEIAQAATFQDLNERRAGRIGSGPWLAGLNLIRLGLRRFRLCLLRLSPGFLLLHGLIECAGDGIEDTTHPYLQL